jgi:type I restriction enzyme, S subunit
MKAGWDVKTLGEVCEIKPPKSEARVKLSPKDLVSFLPMEALGINQKYFQANQTKTLEDVVGGYTYFADGDVLLAKITPCFENGKLGIANNLSSGVGFGSSEYIVFRPYASLKNEWLYYYISRQTFRSEGAERMTGAVGHKRVSKEFIENYQIPIPPIQEQQRIVAKLDKAFEGIAKAHANAEQNLQNARALFESHLQSIFTQRGEGWVDTMIGECINFIDYRGKTPEKTQTGIPLITAKNVKMGYIKDEPKEYVSPDIYHEWMTRGIPRKGDVLFTTEAPLANVAQLNTDEKVVFAQRIIIMQPHENKLNQNFLKYLLLSSPIQRRILEKATGATAQGIKASLLRTIKISFPHSIAEQVRFANQFETLSKETQRLEALYQRKIACLDELKKSLLQQAFAGEL